MNWHQIRAQFPTLAEKAFVDAACVSLAPRAATEVIVSFTVGSAEANVALMEHLLDHKVLVSVRYTSNVGGLRVSCHYYNTFEDLDRLLSLLKVSLPGPGAVGSAVRRVAGCR